MEPALITLILNLVLIVFIFLGFLGGLKGIKKSSFNLILLLINVILVIFLTPIFSEVFLNVNISGKTIYEHISFAVSDAVGSNIASSDFIKNLTSSIPAMIANLVVSILLLLLFGLVLKIIGAIVYRIIFKKDKKKEVEKCELVNGVPQMVKVTVKKKKYRLLGGLVGCVYGFLFATFMFFPICGLVSVCNDVIGVGKANAETNTSQILYFDEMIQENLPREVIDYTTAFNDSILFKIGKIGNLSEASFNLVSRGNINGTSISIGEEVQTFVKAYNTIIDFAKSNTQTPLSEYTFDSVYNDLINNPNNYDFNKLYNSVDLIFNSNLINATGMDALKLVGDVLVQNAEDEQSLKLLNHIKTALYNYANSNAKLKDDFKAFVGTFEVAAKCGLIQAINNENTNIKEISNILLNPVDISTGKPENEYLNKLTSKLSSSVLLQKFVMELANYGIGELEKEMRNSLNVTGEPISLTYIDSSKNYEIKGSELSKLIVDFIELSENVEIIDEKAVQEDLFNVFDSDVEVVISSFGSVINDFVSLSILKDSGVYASICDEMARTEYNEYISFEELKNGKKIKDQFDYLAESVISLKESGIINDIRYIDNIDNSSEKIANIISKLATKNDGQTTNISKIVTPLLKCEILKSAVGYALDESHKYLKNELSKINPDVILEKFNTEEILTEQENANLIKLLNNLVEFANGVDLSKLLTNEFIDNLLQSESNIANLGNALDSIKDSKLFKDYEGKEGVYKNIMKALSGYEVFSDFFDFEVAKQEEFSWIQTTQNLISLKQNLDQVYVIYDGQQVKLLKYILTNGSYDSLMDSLQGQNVNLKVLFELDVLKPTSIKVINIINSTIKGFINDDNLSANIVDIDMTANIFDQAESINSIINKALKLDFNYIKEVGIENISESEMQKVKDLLTELEANSKLTDSNDNEIGVFKASYNAMAKKVVTEINKAVAEELGNEEFVQEIIEEIPNLEVITDVLEQGQKVFDMIDENTKIEDIQETQEFEDFMNSLQENEYTQKAYDMIQEYLNNLGNNN